MEELVTLIVKSYGLAGIVMLAPFVALYFVWKWAKDLQAQLAAANERVNEVHAKRVADAQQVADKLMEMAKEHAALSKETNMALDRVGDMLSVLQSNAIAVRAAQLPPYRKGRTGSDGE